MPLTLNFREARIHFATFSRPHWDTHFPPLAKIWSNKIPRTEIICHAEEARRAFADNDKDDVFTAQGE